MMKWLHRIELTTSCYLLWRDFLNLDFGPARIRERSLQFIVIDEIYVEISNSWNNGLDINVHLVSNKDDVRVFCGSSGWALFLCLVRKSMV